MVLCPGSNHLYGRNPLEKGEEITNTAGDIFLGGFTWGIDTWLWHCPFLTPEQVTGLRHFSNSSPVHGPGTELVQVSLLQAADLGVQKGTVSSALPAWGGQQDTGEAEKTQLNPWCSCCQLCSRWIPCKLAEGLAGC